MPHLHPSDTVRVHTDYGWRPVQLLPDDQQPKEPRSYNVRTPAGNILRRNRRHLLRTREQDIFRRDEVDDAAEVDDMIQGAQAPPGIDPVHSSLGTNKNVTSRSGRVSVRPARFQDYV